MTPPVRGTIDCITNDFEMIKPVLYCMPPFKRKNSTGNLPKSTWKIG